MVFSSAVFLFSFLPIVFVGNFLINEKYSNYFLLLASLVFYAWGEPSMILLMIILIIINWLIGLMLSKTSGKFRSVLLIIGLIFDLGVLGFYKYSAFFASSLNNVLKSQVFPIVEVALPIGISFFTFRAISYLVDVYRRDTEPSSSLVNVALYISFFPQLISGPIVRYKDINEQISNRSVNWIGISDGIRRFMYGIGKKVLIANTLGVCADTVFSFDISIIDCKTAWIGALAYTFQIYYDFSGYSDMAIGLSKMFGFNIPENFDYPYLSSSITEFWRRWHISLGYWFREYLYIPLGGNRKGNFRTYLNLFIVFFLTGLWHGAGLSFIAWGLYHGFFSILERLSLKKLLDKSKFISTIYAFLVVTVGWVFFRSERLISALRFLSRMFLPWRHMELSLDVWSYIDNKTIFMFACAVLGMGIFNKLLPNRIKNTWKNSVVEALYCVCIMVLSISAVANGTYNPFIYFQF